MSIEALNWALKVKTGSPQSKSVLLILANHTNQDGRCWPGFDGIAKQTELSRSTVIRHIKLLQDSGFVIKERAKDKPGCSNRYYLNVNRPEQCQSDTSVRVTPHQCQSDTTTSVRVTPEPSVTINEPPKNGRVTSTAGFDEFWEAYPKKVKKKTALEIWKRKKPDAALLVADIKKRMQYDKQWRDGFIPHATTYLNGERWHDAIEGELAMPVHKPRKREEVTPAMLAADRAKADKEMAKLMERNK